MKDIALAYAAAGWPVLWVYGMRQDDAGEWGCRCPTYGQKGCNATSKSRGKHPPFAGHGALDATTDPAIIESWPWDQEPNIAIAGRDSNVIIDIDDPTISAKLLDPEFGLADMATVATTGRGLHIYLQCAPTKNGVPQLKSGDAIGEIRASGYYVVAPPSMHYSGKPYRWLGGSLLQQGPTITDKDAWGYLEELLAPLGVELKSKKTTVPIRPREEPFEALSDLPYATTNATILAEAHAPQMFAASKDRSIDLFRLACDLHRDIRSLRADVTPAALAGVLKNVDIQRGNYHPRGPKYAFRDSADNMYWTIIHEAAQAVDAEQSKTTKAPTDEDGLITVLDNVPPTAGQTDFFWIEKPPSFMWREPGSKRNVAYRVANFEPRILEEVTSWDETMDIDAARLWTVQLRQGDEVKMLKIDSDEYKDSKKLVAEIQAHVRSHFIIADSMTGKFAQGIREYSGVVPERRALAASGWVPNRNAFLLPGGPGAITADGFDESTLYENPKAPGRFLQYGWSVLPKEGADLAAVARALFNLREPAIMIPIMNQVFGSTMTSIGVGKHPIVAHMFARTGSFKSTVARAAISVFGRFTNAQTDQVEEWKSTDTSLGMTMHRTRDLPLIIDDFKLISFDQRELGRRINLIQAYGDRTGRTRATIRQTEQEHMHPRCLLLSTGEDIWDGQESAIARTLIIDASLADDREKVASLKRRLTNLQAMANEGLLGALGYEWIHWMVCQGYVAMQEQIAERYLAKMEGMSKSELNHQHPRVASSVAMLLTVSSLFIDFLKERVPDFLDEYQELARNGWGQAVNMAAVKAEDAKSLSPYYQLTTAIINALAAGQCYVQQRTKTADPIGDAGQEVVGYTDDEAIWLNEPTTLGWYQAQQRRRGLDSHIGWDAFLQEAKRDHSATQTQHPTAIYGRTSIRMVRIPIREFFGDIGYEALIENRTV